MYTYKLDEESQKYIVYSPDGDMISDFTEESTAREWCDEKNYKGAEDNN